MNDIEIIIIDDSIKIFDPLIVELAIKYNESNVKLFNKSKQGLDYVLNNLSRRMIVLLDYNFTPGEPKGHDVLLDIRKKTSLVYVIIMTAKQFSSIPHYELIDFVNNDALAVVQNTTDTKQILKLVSKAEHRLSVHIDSVLEDWLCFQKKEVSDVTIMTDSSGKSYTYRDLISEIRMETIFGKEIEKDIMSLAVDLFLRNINKQTHD